MAFTPGTVLADRWYFFRSALVAVVVVGIAFGALKISLGRQSMFPVEE